MGNRLYVGNLPFSASEQSLTALFSQCGTVSSVKIISDHDTGKSKGFCFVEMSDAAEAQDIINKFNNADYEGRAMKISEAKAQIGGERRSFSSRGRPRTGW